MIFHSLVPVITFLKRGWVPLSLFGAALFFAGLGLSKMALELFEKLPSVSANRQRQAFRKVSDRLRELDELLASGLVPSSEQWESLSDLPAPWAKLSYESVREIRAQGGSVRPTLRRLRELALSQDRLVAEARARASQSLGQAATCAFLSPALGAILYRIAPGVDERCGLWWAACAVSFLFCMGGALWMLSLAEEARWAGLPPEKRHWILAAQCAGERFLSILRGGNPADIAWSKACGLLSLESPQLALFWGHSFWRSEPKREGGLHAVRGAGEGELPPLHLNPGEERVSSSGLPAERSLIEAGDAMRKAVQSSLMDGRPCGERVEAALEALRQELRIRVDVELSQLPNRTLRPLFICVAPAILGLLAFGLYICWLQASRDL